MMKTFLSSVLLSFVAFSALTAQSAYETNMQQSLTFMEQGQMQAAQQMFERIAMMETSEWVPLYHSANILIGQSFEAEGKEQLDLLLNKAKELVAEAHDRSPDNAELLSLEAMLYTSYLSFDAATYGMIYAPKVSALHEKAVALAPDNPRVLINSLEYNIGSARFFGRDIAPICEQVEATKAMFETYESEVPFGPTGGLEKAERISADCNND